MVNIIAFGNNPANKPCNPFGWWNWWKHLWNPTNLQCDIWNQCDSGELVIPPAKQTQHFLQSRKWNSPKALHKTSTCKDTEYLKSKLRVCVSISRNELQWFGSPTNKLVSLPHGCSYDSLFMTDFWLCFHILRYAMGLRDSWLAEPQTRYLNQVLFMLWTYRAGRRNTVDCFQAFECHL